MTKQVQRRRGTSTQHTSFTGAEGEISVNTTNKSIHVHDGLTAGGVEAARADLTNVSDANLNAALSGNTLSSLTITSVDINGGTIDGAVIGGSSAAAGTFTTVTASGDVTIADKIVHSGDTNTAIRFPAADTVTVETSGAERLRVTSTGDVGIGRANPTTKLDVGEPADPAISMDASASGNFRLTGANYSFAIANNDVGTFLYNNGSSRAMVFGVNETERMRIDASGKVGIGMTPTGTLSIRPSGTGSEDSHFGFGANLDTYITTGADGIVVFREGNGAGANTERMRIDSSGNVGIGTSSGTGRLTVADGTTAVLTLRATSAIDPAGRVIGTINFQEPEGTGDGTLTVESSISALREGSDAFNSGGYLTFSTRPFNGSLTERLRIDASGNLGLGVTPSAWGSGYRTAQLGNQGASISGNTTISQAVLGSNGFYNGTNWIYNNSDSAGQYRLDGNVHKWFTAPSGTAGNTITFTERARIDASGNLLVGTTAANGGLSVSPTGATYTGFFVGAADGFNIACRGGSTTGTAIRILNGSGTAVGSITYTASATAYNTSSDYRLKENVAPMQNALDTVAQLNPVTYTWKADGSAGQGFIAHELQAVVPDCVTGTKDAVDADGNPDYQGVDTSFLVATLVKAIQELKAEVDSLRA